jgi:DNA mismatch repair protein MutH
MSTGKVWKTKDEILKHGKDLVQAGSLSKAKCVVTLDDKVNAIVLGARSRAGFGSVLENYYYGINPGNSPEPDFPEVGVELKSTSIKKNSKGFVAKERLVLNKIDFKKEAHATFETSSFIKKNRSVMLVSYLHVPGEAVVDVPIKIAELVEFENLPEEDRRIIREDWDKIHSKIVANKAHELSEGDTFYLGACTKAATGADLTSQNDGVHAKPRAYSFKSGYMTALTKRFLGKDDTAETILKPNDVKQKKTFEEIVIEKFDAYKGMTIEEIGRKVAPDIDLSKSKGALAALARRIMGVKTKSVAEFDKADVLMKTVQLKKNGIPKEDVSFPSFKAKELAYEDWELEPEDAALDSDRAPSTFKAQLSKRFFFVIFKCEKDCKKGDKKVFHGVKFWSMPVDILNGVVREQWERTVSEVKRSSENNFPRSSEKKVIHVRTHGIDGKDMDEMLDGTKMTKKCFWLNANYLVDILSK